MAFVQAMGSVGLLFYFLSTGAGFLQFYWEYRKKRRLLYASGATGMIAGSVYSIKFTTAYIGLICVFFASLLVRVNKDFQGILVRMNANPI